MLLAINFLFVIGLLLSSATGDNDSDNASSQASDSQGEALIDWLHSKGGTFNEKLEIRRVDRSDQESKYGIFAKEDIRVKELLFDIPAKCLITWGLTVVSERL